MRVLLALLGLALADEAAPPAAEKAEETEISEAYDVMKDLDITLVSEILDGSSFTIRDKGSEVRTIRVGYTAGHTDYVASLKKLLDRSMLLYKAWPAELQTVPGEILADVWTTEGMHIGLALERAHGPSRTGIEQTTDYTKDILQVAAEKEKQKSYKKLEEALKEQGEFEHTQRMEAKFEDEKTSIDVKMILGGVLLAVCFMYPIYLAISAASSDNKAADKAASRQRDMMKQQVELARKQAELDAANADLRLRQKAAAKQEREEQEAADLAKKGGSKKA